MSPMNGLTESCDSEAQRRDDPALQAGPPYAIADRNPLGSRPAIRMRTILPLRRCKL